MVIKERYLINHNNNFIYRLSLAVHIYLQIIKDEEILETEKDKMCRRLVLGGQPVHAPGNIEIGC